MINGGQQGALWVEDADGFISNAAVPHPPARRSADNSLAGSHLKGYGGVEVFGAHGAAEDGNGAPKWVTGASIPFGPGIVMKAVEPLEDAMSGTNELLPMPTPVAPSSNDIMLALERRRRMEQERQYELAALAKALAAAEASAAAAARAEEGETTSDDDGSEESDEYSDRDPERQDRHPPVVEGTAAAGAQTSSAAPAPGPGPQPEEENRLVLPVLESLIALRQRRLNPKPPGSSSHKPQPQPPAMQRTDSMTAKSAGAARTPVRRGAAAASPSLSAAAAAPAAAASGPSFSAASHSVSFSRSTLASAPSASNAAASSLQPPAPSPLSHFLGSWRASRKWSPTPANPADAGETAFQAHQSTSPSPAPPPGAAATSNGPVGTATGPAPAAAASTPSSPTLGRPKMDKARCNMALSSSFTFGHRLPNGQLAMPMSMPPSATSPSLPPHTSASMPNSAGDIISGGVSRVTRFATALGVSMAEASGSDPHHHYNHHHHQQQQLAPGMLQDWQSRGTPMLPIDDDSEDAGSETDEDGDVLGLAPGLARGVDARGGGGGRTGNGGDEDSKASWRRARRITQSFDMPGMDALGPQAPPHGPPGSAPAPGQDVEQLMGPSGAPAAAAAGPWSRNPTGGGPLSPMASRRMGAGEAVSAAAAAAAVSAAAAAAAAVAAAGASVSGRPALAGPIAMPIWFDKALGRGGGGAGGGAAAAASGTSPGVAADGPAVAAGRTMSVTTGGSIPSSTAPKGPTKTSSFTSKFMSFKTRVQSISSSQLTFSPGADPTGASLPGAGNPAAAAAAGTAAAALRPRANTSGDGRGGIVGGGGGGGGGGLPGALSSPDSPQYVGRVGGAGGGGAGGVVNSINSPEVGGMPQFYVRPANRPMGAAATQMDPSVVAASGRSFTAQGGQQQPSPPVVPVAGNPRVPAGRGSLDARPAAPTAAAAPAGTSRGRFSLEAQSGTAPGQQQAPDTPQLMVMNSFDRRRGDPAGWNVAPPGLLPPVRLL